MVNKGREGEISDELVSTGEGKQQREGLGYIRSLRVSIMSEKIPTPPLSLSPAGGGGLHPKAAEPSAAVRQTMGVDPTSSDRNHEIGQQELPVCDQVVPRRISDTTMGARRVHNYCHRHWLN